MAKDLQWIAIIRGDKYQVDFSAKTLSISEGPLRISRLYGLNKNGFDYVLAILTNGTYRLYSKGKRKLYFAGKTKTIRFIPEVIIISDTKH